MTVKFADTDLVPATESQCQSLIAGWFNGSNANWPLSTEDVAGLLREKGQYDIDASQLHMLKIRGQMPSIESWDAKDVVFAASVLESRRQWLSQSSLHDAKKTAEQLNLEALLAKGEDGELEVLGQTHQVDLRLAIHLITESDSRVIRERFLVILLAILRLEHGIKV